jgi:hypothetical protein
VPECSVKAGDVVEVRKGIPMQDFHSETLDRTFSMIYFSPGLKVTGPAEAAEAPAQAPSQAPASLPPGHPDLSQTSGASLDSKGAIKDFSGVEKPEGGMTIAEIYAGKDELSGKEVVVRGKVVKFNSKIMGKNWLHLRDGSGEEGSNDLTINTQAEAKVGDTVLVRGVVVLNKDFGFGYKYDVLIEDAALTRE